MFFIFFSVVGSWDELNFHHICLLVMVYFGYILELNFPGCIHFNFTQFGGGGVVVLKINFNSTLDRNYVYIGFGNECMMDILVKYVTFKTNTKIFQKRHNKSQSHW